MNDKKKRTFGRDFGIRNSIFMYFTITALAAVLLIGISIYSRFSKELVDTVKKENVNLVGQISSSLEVYLRDIMKLSDSIYYGVIKNTDLSDISVNNNLNLLYGSNKNKVLNIALFSREGELLEAVPAVRLKKGRRLNEESWFKKALDKPENIHFTTPHVQYGFEVNDNKYKWVITLSRAVEITTGGRVEQAVLLIDLSYQALGEVLSDTALENRGYLYLINAEGKLIWHPEHGIISSGRKKENVLLAAGYTDGSHEERLDGKKRTVSVKTVGYTGWKLVGVREEGRLYVDSLKLRLFGIFAVSLILFVVLSINSYISTKITNPIRELEKSVNELEAGNLDAKIYVGGSLEVKHLGTSLLDMRRRIKGLMADIVKEHESKRKSEFESLQSQINPHFLYNTLDIIVWMIENEKKEEAVRAVTALARFFRVSLSKGKSVIPVRSELEHVKNYLMIQQMRFKNKFTYHIVAEEDVMELSAIKLMLQPMVENSIYHGMEFMDGDGEIEVKAWREGEDLYFSIRDNGLGMTKERAEEVLLGKSCVSNGKGSGIGVKNVNERIKLYFGEAYGLKIESEPDEGTVVTLHLPARNDEEVNREQEI